MFEPGVGRWANKTSHFRTSIDDLSGHPLYTPRCHFVLTGTASVDVTRGDKVVYELEALYVADMDAKKFNCLENDLEVPPELNTVTT